MTIINYRKISAILVFSVLFVLIGNFTAAQAQTKKKTAPKPRYYKIAAGEKVRVRMEDALNSKTARVGDTFKTKTVEPVYSSGGIQLIPIGSVIEGRVAAAQAAKKGGNPGTIDVVFTAVRLPNGRRAAINGSLDSFEEDETKADNEGQVSGKKTSNRKVKFIGGGAAGGAIIGGIAGGGKGAVIGGIIGAGGGLLGEKLTKGKDAEVKEGTEFGVYLNRSISLPAFK